MALRDTGSGHNGVGWGWTWGSERSFPTIMPLYTQVVGFGVALLSRELQTCSSGVAFAIRRRSGDYNCSSSSVSPYGSAHSAELAGFREASVKRAATRITPGEALGLQPRCSGAMGPENGLQGPPWAAQPGSALPFLGFCCPLAGSELKVGWGGGGRRGVSRAGGSAVPGTELRVRTGSRKKAGRVSRSIPAPSVGFLFFLRQLSIDAILFLEAFLGRHYRPQQNQG